MSTITKSKQFFGFIVWLLIPFIAAGIGSIATINAQLFYSELIRPPWSPPGFAFGPVWTLLYALMGVAAWLIWRRGGFHQARAALSLFLVQLSINALWSWLFFTWHLGLASFVGIVILWILITATLIVFWRLKTLAGVLLIPYLLWVSFAAVLNYAIWQLNPHILI